MMNPISQSMIPSQMSTRKALVNPQEFSQSDWMFEINRTSRLNWRPGTADQSDFNYFDTNEPWKFIKNSMFNPLTGEEPIYGHVNYTLNPLAQEQTGAHTSAYNLDKISRVSFNNSPIGAMKAPPYRYPVNVPLNSYKGSMSRPRYN